MENEKDMTSELCVKCKKGHYKETKLQDDWDGVLHCDECNHEIDRWQKNNTE